MVMEIQLGKSFPFELIRRKLHAGAERKHYQSAIDLEMHFPIV